MPVVECICQDVACDKCGHEYMAILEPKEYRGFDDCHCCTDGKRCGGKLIPIGEKYMHVFKFEHGDAF